MAWLTARGGHQRARPAAASPQGQPTGANCQRPALSPAGAVAPVAGVAAPWQGGCRPQMATVAYAGQWQRWRRVKEG
ncbi:hypothetical protein BHM03_00051978 [Ensete ventricosum]|nr:hypothetical protein BHM03_00051978 [Ensete ventricosum]